MKNKIRKLICWIIGHRYRCLHRHLWGTEHRGGSTTTAWECQCCGEQDVQQWDM